MTSLAIRVCWWVNFRIFFTFIQGPFEFPGDHQQLRPNTASMDIGSSYRLNISFFERLINNDAKWSSLSTQHRMRPEIAELICPAIYPNLTNSPSVTLYPDVKGVAKNVFFFSHTHPEKDVRTDWFYFNIYHYIDWGIVKKVNYIRVHAEFFIAI